MSMYLQYGNYQHALGECAVQIVRTPAWQHGTVTHIHEEWLISGRMQQSNSALLTLALEALQLGYSFNGQNIGLFFQGGTPTVHAINNINTLGGTKVLQSPTYEQGKGAEYSTFRNYTIRVGADICNPLCMLVFWKERINIRAIVQKPGYPQHALPLVIADDVRVAGELGALLDKGFFAQDLPKLPEHVKTASELISEAV